MISCSEKGGDSTSDNHNPPPRYGSGQFNYDTISPSWTGLNHDSLYVDTNGPMNVYFVELAVGAFQDTVHIATASDDAIAESEDSEVPNVLAVLIDGEYQENSGYEMFQIVVAVTSKSNPPFGNLQLLVFQTDGTKERVAQSSYASARPKEKTLKTN